LVLAESLSQNRAFAKAYNLGPHASDCVSVRKLIELAQLKFGKGETQFPIQHSAPHEATVLMLNANLAAQELDIKPRWNLETTVAKTMNWYRHFYEGQAAFELCRADILEYENIHVAL
jgi:CDP-glucose 4,6-dehydratase